MRYFRPFPIFKVLCHSYALVWICMAGLFAGSSLGVAQIASEAPQPNSAEVEVLSKLNVEEPIQLDIPSDTNTSPSADTPQLAETPSSANDETGAMTGGEGIEVLDEIVVTADRIGSSMSPDLVVGRSLRIAGLAMQPVAELKGEELTRRAQGTLGETLAWEPGVSSGYFGPGSSRPIIRGFDGFRVKILRDDLSTMDLSDVSPDHGIGVEPLLAEAIEVHRGPAALLYGNAAIGGAVNTRSRVIARELPPRALTGSLESRIESVSQGWAQTGYVAANDGPWVLHLTGSLRESEDVRIPGRARTEDYEKTERPRVTDPALGITATVPNPDGILTNSWHRSQSASAGISWLPEDMPVWAGVSWSWFNSLYGLPYIFSGDATDFNGDSFIHMKQQRYDFELGVDLETGPLKKLQIHAAHSDYEHDELFSGLGRDAGLDFSETFMTKSTQEARLDLLHGGFEDRLEGIVGFHGFLENFNASRMVVAPPTEVRVPSYFNTQNAGFYTLEKFSVQDWQFQVGARWETQEIEDETLANFIPPTIVQEEALSYSGGITWSRADLWTTRKLSVTGLVSKTERIPTATERYAFWNNAGLGRFLVGGDMDGEPLGLEKSLGFELGLSAEWERTNFRLNGFWYDYENFIFLQEIPTFINRAVQYIERETTLYGWEAELDLTLYQEGEKKILLTLMGDSVYGHNKTDNEPLPRMPPLRLGGRLEFSTQRLIFGIEARHVFAQDRLKPEPRGELPTDAYTLVGADISWKMSRQTNDILLTLQVSNLLNEEARLHTSFRKDVAPLPGLGVTASVRWSF